MPAPTKATTSPTTIVVESLFLVSIIVYSGIAMFLWKQKDLSSTQKNSNTFKPALKETIDDNDDDDDDDLPFQSGQGTRDSHQPLHAPYHHERLSLTQIATRARRFRSLLRGRRTVRFFAPDAVPRSVLQDILATAASAPSGAHKQPWQFCLIGNPTLKRQIRDLVEREEQINYDRRMKTSWVEDLRNMLSAVHSTEQVSKPYLTDAPWLIVVLKQPFAADQQGKKVDDHYYVPESVGIACGFLVAAIHNADLVTLTSTPMGAGAEICRLLDRPSHEKVFLLLPVGFPAKNATVPYRESQRKPLEQVVTVY